MSKQAEAKSAVMDALREAGAPMTRKALEEATGYGGSLVTKALAQLVEEKRVSKGDKDESGAIPYAAIQRTHRVQRKEPSLALFKPLRQGTRRALTATLALQEGGVYVDDVADALNAQFPDKAHATRNWVIAEYSALASERGLGYEYEGDRVRLLLPEGVEDPFSPVRKAEPEAEADGEPQGEPEGEPEGEPQADGD